MQTKRTLRLPNRAQVLAYIRRLVAYVIGMFFIASGVTLSRSTHWGISPVNSIPNVLSLQFEQPSFGIWVIIVFTGFILVQALILLRKFKWYSFLQLLSSTLFGFLVDGTDALFGLFLPQEQAVWLKVLFICISTVVIAFGIFLYLEGEHPQHAGRRGHRRPLAAHGAEGLYLQDHLRRERRAHRQRPVPPLLLGK